MLFEATHTDHGDAVDGVEDDGVALEYRLTTTQGGKNRRRGKNESDHEKRELTFKEDGQGQCNITSFVSGTKQENSIISHHPTRVGTTTNITITITTILVHEITS